MFPTFDVPPQHAETVGARKARRAREDDTNRTSSTASLSSGSSVRNVKPSASSTKSSEKSSGGVFGWARKKQKEKEILEIVTIPSAVKKSPPAAEQPYGRAEAETPISPTSDWSASLAVPHHHEDPRRRRPERPVRPEDLPAPPTRSLPQPPSLPPVTALPPPPQSSSAAEAQLSLRGLSINDRTRASQLSHASSVSPSTTSSSDRTGYSSSRSVFSSASGYDSVISEQSSVDPRNPSNYGSNLQLEPVESSRSNSSMGDRSSVKSAQGPFARALAKMESAGARIVTARLSEEWDGLDDDESFQEVVFEKRLWALTAYQRLTQNKHLQSPAHELLSNSRPADQRRILHLHGSLADGWMLATHYPSATVYTTSSNTTFKVPTSYPAPLNHHSLYVPSLSTAMPFPDGYFDAIVSRSVSTVLRNEEWARTFFDCRRVLKPGGQIEILSIDAHLTSEGQRLANWVDDQVVSRLEAHGLSKLPSDTVLDTMEIVGLENIRRARVALPAHLNAAKSRAGADDAGRMMTFLGRHFYQDLYGKLLSTAHQGEEWFWSRRDIREECERHHTKVVLTIACAHKPTASPNESYLDL